MCQIIGREGTASFGGDTCIGSEDVARKREEGSKYPPPPSGTRLRKIGIFLKIFRKFLGTFPDILFHFPDDRYNTV